MIIVTGDGKIIKNLDRAGVIAELQKAQKRGDKFCSITGAYQDGLDPVDLENEARYKIGATEKQSEAALSRAARELGRKGGSSRSEAKQASSRENGKKGGRPKGRPRTNK